MDGRRFRQRPPPLGKERRTVTITGWMIALGAVELSRILYRMIDILEGRHV